MHAAHDPLIGYRDQRSAAHRIIRDQELPVQADVASVRIIGPYDIQRRDHPGIRHGLLPVIIVKPVTDRLHVNIGDAAVGVKIFPESRLFRSYLRAVFRSLRSRPGNILHKIIRSGFIGHFAVLPGSVSAVIIARLSVPGPGVLSLSLSLVFSFRFRNLVFFRRSIRIAFLLSVPVLHVLLCSVPGLLISLKRDRHHILIVFRADGSEARRRRADRCDGSKHKHILQHFILHINLLPLTILPVHISPIFPGAGSLYLT